jgi:hypothetical protein
MEALKTRYGSDSVLRESLGQSLAWAIAYGSVRGRGFAGARARQTARCAAGGHSVALWSMPCSSAPIQKSKASRPARIYW